MERVDSYANERKKTRERDCSMDFRLSTPWPSRRQTPHLSEKTTGSSNRRGTVCFNGNVPGREYIINGHGPSEYY
ncbi:MAG: hypothetical protein LAKADJCE_00971 [Candidatus Argoarchaeum ethanivorans]|uniref:Uncharacterized protein n=1 Tax=Candidatus Argoarchaeum ethanivorans TaxID=2608793 RepID=A0A811TEH4_9EURY|nr:MAG: hypothetical protein LAKADJCE_00971 [Candidatus Argoarchaeum ethanivorans]